MNRKDLKKNFPDLPELYIDFYLTIDDDFTKKNLTASTMAELNRLHDKYNHQEQTIKELREEILKASKNDGDYCLFCNADKADKILHKQNCIVLKCQLD